METVAHGPSPIHPVHLIRAGHARRAVRSHTSEQRDPDPTNISRPLRHGKSPRTGGRALGLDRRPTRSAGMVTGSGGSPRFISVDPPPTSPPLYTDPRSAEAAPPPRIHHSRIFSVVSISRTQTDPFFPSQMRRVAGGSRAGAPPSTRRTPGAGRLSQGKTIVNTASSAHLPKD